MFAQRSLRVLGAGARRQALLQQWRPITSLSGGFRNTDHPDSFDPTSYKQRALPAGRHPLDPVPKGIMPKLRALEDLDRPSVVRGVRAALWVGAILPPWVYMNYIDPGLTMDIKLWCLSQGLPEFSPGIWIPLLLAELSWPVRTLLTFYLFRLFYHIRDKFMRPF